VGLRAALDIRVDAREKIFFLPGIEPRSFSLKSDTILTELSQLYVYIQKCRAYVCACLRVRL
jgi:hypothetical protein